MKYITAIGYRKGVYRNEEFVYRKTKKDPVCYHDGCIAV